MDIQDYFGKLNTESQMVFNKSILEKERLGTLHHSSSCIFEFASCVLDPQERGILVTVSAQLDSATFSLVLGLYRQAFSSLRLALEMGLASIYFSVNKMDLHEWLDGRMDIKWSKLVDDENGVLGERLVKAFFPELIDEVEAYRIKAINVYRTLSEYVHGNHGTWVNNDIKLAYKDNLFDKYFNCHRAVFEVILFGATCRYGKLFSASDLESLQFLSEEFNHVSEIRELIGRL